ncbi:MAG TPA: cytochrome P450 [Nocardioidaceae bacterium]|nr:cytochrome P450 [Nocardioidaceae bacterium]
MDQLSAVTRPPSEPAFDARRFPPAARRNRLVQTLRLNNDPLAELLRARDRHGSVFTLRILPYRAGIVCATDPETNQQVLTDDSRFAAGDAADLIEPLVGSGSLILTPSPRHGRNRKLLMPPFHGQRIARWSDVIGELVEEQLPDLLTGSPVAVRPWAQRLTLEVILRVVFGVEDKQRRDVYREALDRLMSPRVLAVLFAPEPLRRDLGRFSPGGQLWRRRRAVDALLLEEIATRRADPRADQKEDVLSVLLSARDEDGVGFTDEELRDELKGLVLAGHETTATALAWTLHLLAHHPAARDRLAADLTEGSRGYLAACIKEAMRLRAPVFDAVRIATTDTELGGRPVPAGAYVSAMFCTTHLAEDVWPDAQSFQPDRHLDGSRSTWSLTPFGGGARRCLGAALAQLELEVVLAKVLERAVPQPAGELERTRLLGVTLVPARGGRVTFHARQDVLA